MVAKMFLRLSAACLLAGPAMADFAPLKKGNKWVYEGARSVDEYWGSRGVRQEKCRLTVTVDGSFKRNDTTFIGITVRDSLYRRFANSNGGTAANTPLRDTVMVEHWKALALGDTAYITSESAIDHSDLFWLMRPPDFFGGRAKPNDFDSVVWTRSGPLMMAAKPLRYGADFKAWYADNIGLYWLKAHRIPGGCDGPIEEELLLESFNGKKVDPGVDPPGSALAKAARAECSVLSRPSGNGLLLRPGVGPADLLGRSVTLRTRR